jgi:enoyl-CoA hydratase/carnithine racemase
MSDIDVSVDGPVATIRLNRPAKRNAITTAMYAEMADTLDAFAEDGEVRIVVITGSGGSFTAGNDLDDMRTTSDFGVDSPPRRFLNALLALPQVLVVGVGGPAIGIGTTLLLHADLVYATSSSVFAMPFVELGLVPEAASTLLLPLLIGHSRAAAMMLLGERVDAARAAEWGLVSGLVDGGQTELDARLAAVAAVLEVAPPKALAHTRRLLRAHRRDKIGERLAEDGALMAALAAERNATR